MVLTWIGWAAVQATTVHAYQIDFEGDQIFSDKLQSSRATIRVPDRRDSRKVAVRLYGVEAFSPAEQEAIHEAKKAHYAKSPRPWCGQLDPIAFMRLSSLFVKPGDPPHLKFFVRGKDPDGTLVVDYRFDSGPTLSTLLLRMGSCKIDPKIVSKDLAVMKEAFEARQRREGNWRWLPEVIPPRS